MSDRACCFDIVLKIDDPKDIKQKYEFVDSEYGITWTFTISEKLVKENYKNFNITLKIDKPKIRFKLDLFVFSAYISGHNYIGPFENKTDVSGGDIWTCEFYAYKSMKLLMKCELRGPPVIYYYPKPKVNMFIKTESDLKIISADNKIHFAHRSILCAASDEFDHLLNSSNHFKKEIELDDIDSETLEAMLEFIYTEKFEHTEFNKVESLLIAAYMYEIRNLKDCCLKYLNENYRMNNVLNLLVFAEKYDEDELLGNCIKYIKLNFDTDYFRESIRKSNINGRVLLMITNELRAPEKFPIFELKATS